MRRVFDRMNNEGYGRKRIVVMILASCLFFVLSGCGKTSYDATTIEFRKDGHIIEHIVEEFPASMYDEAEWEAEAKSLISDHNASGRGQIELNDVVYENDILKCSLDYEDDDAYYYFNEQPIFYGTIADAIKAGYSLMVPVTEVETGNSIGADRLKLMKESNIVILSGQTKFKLCKPAKYISENVQLDPKGKSGSITNDNACYLVFE